MSDASKRVIPLMALAACVVAMLGGCGQKEEPATDGPVVPITTTTTDQTGGQGGDRRGDSTVTESGGADGGAGQAMSAGSLVRETVERFLVSPNADAVCRNLLTPEMLRRAYGGVAGCKAAREPAALAKSAQVSNVQILGRRAQADARPNGGVNDGERLSFRLTKAGKTWRIESLKSNARVGP